MGIVKELVEIGPNKVYDIFLIGILLSLSLDDSRTTLGECFRKNSMEFSIGLNYLLILLYKWLYTTSSMITCPSGMFYNHLTLSRDISSHAVYIFSSLYDLIFAIKCLNARETFSFLGLS